MTSPFSPLKLVGYLIMEQPTLPPIPWPRGYVLAGNGIFAWAKREGLEVLIPIASCQITGLYPVEPFVRLAYPPVDAWLVSEMLRYARAARTSDGVYQEILFYVQRDTKHGWHLFRPEQRQDVYQVRAVLGESDQQTYANTLLEVHSHHQMPAFFSGTDDREEQGFRIYTVIGRINATDEAAEIRVRVGLFGHFWEVPASLIFALPWGITDCVGREPFLADEQAQQPGGPTWTLI